MVAVRRLAIALGALGTIALLVAPAGATKRHSHKPSGVAGVVLNSTCAGACAEPPPPEPVYSGAVTITVQRVSDGQQVATQASSDGHFRIRLKRGSYDVSSVPPNPEPQPPSCPPGELCPLDKESAGGAESAVIVRPCLQGETKRVQVRRHRFTQVELHVANVCIV
jgi:hypothetical protein